MSTQNTSQISPQYPNNHPQMVQEALLGWYYAHKRNLPWRPLHIHQRPDPYHVWLSEIMLQQTTVATVTQYYQKFLRHWQTVVDLANAPRDDVLSAWAGLGYYARARNLHKCAQVIRDNYNGHFPTTESELLKLPGVGSYTAAAIAAIAFDKRAVVVDGNVERVISRLFNFHGELPKARPDIYTLTDLCTPDVGSGDLAQAFMDLGATICRPKNPTCDLCPAWSHCLARAQGLQTVLSLPKKAPKKAKPVRTCYGYVIQAKGCVLLEKRPDKGLLGGMLGIPSTAWNTAPLPPLNMVNLGIVTTGTLPLLQQDVHTNEPVAHTHHQDNKMPPHYPLNWHKDGGRATLLSPCVRHTFTHFHLDTHVIHVNLGNHLPNVDTPYGWYTISTLDTLALPTVMTKSLFKALNHKS